MKNILSVLVENRSGVLARTAGLFARRGFNIESLAVGETDNPTISRMTIVTQGDERIMEQVEKQLNKHIDVIKVRQLDAENVTRRELALIKVSATPKNRGQLQDICSIMKASIVDISPTTLTIEITDRPEKVLQLIGLLEPFGIIELVRTGMIAMEKGSTFLSVPDEQPK